MGRPSPCYCNGVSKRYGSLQVLQDCSLTVRPGERVALVGENGSGKSTFLRCLLGFTKPDCGIIELDRSFGYCPQDNFLNKAYTVSEHFALMRQIYAKHSPVRGDYFRSLIDTMRISQYEDVRIEQLSGGTYQKVKFISAAMHQPVLLILDEPYDGFDWAIYNRLWTLLAEMSQNGTTVLLVTHLLYDVDHVDRVCTLHDGRIVDTDKEAMRQGVAT